MGTAIMLNPIEGGGTENVIEYTPTEESSVISVPCSLDSFSAVSIITDDMTTIPTATDGLVWTSGTFINGAFYGNRGLVVVINNSGSSDYWSETFSATLAQGILTLTLKKSIVFRVNVTYKILVF